MPRFGFPTSHEPFPPSELLALLETAEDGAFDCARSSDHFRPWGAAQGQASGAPVLPRLRPPACDKLL